MTAFAAIARSNLFFEDGEVVVKNLLATPPQKGLDIQREHLWWHVHAIGTFHSKKRFLVRPDEEYPGFKTTLEECFETLYESSVKRETLAEPIIALPALYAAARYFSARDFIEESTKEVLKGAEILSHKQTECGLFSDMQHRRTALENLREEVVAQAVLTALAYFAGDHAEDSRRGGLDVRIAIIFMDYTDPASPRYLRRLCSAA